MNENPDNSEWLIRWLDGDLDGNELAAANERLAREPALQAEMDNLRLTGEVVQQYGLKKKIGLLHAEMMREQRQAPFRLLPRRPVNGWLAAAAVVVIAVIASLYPYFTASPDRLFNESFSPYAAGQARGSGTGVLSSAYAKGDMPATVAAYETGLAMAPEDDLEAASAYLSLHHPEAAIGALQRLQEGNRNAGTHFFEEDGQYYLALAYLDNKQPALALPLLQTIHNDTSHPYHNRVSWWFLRKLQRVAR